MNCATSATKGPQFKGLRGLFWPIYKHECKKLLPMAAMVFCMMLIFSILRDLKDMLIICMPSGGAESISFLKIYGVFPFSLVFLLIYFKMVNTLTRDKIFYWSVSLFLAYFFVFGWIIYPFKEFFHLNPQTIETLQKSYLPMDTLYWLIPIMGNWSCSLFYIFAELWASVVYLILFWQFANEITKVQEAKRFYGFLGMIGSLALALSGYLIIFCSNLAQGAENAGTDSFEMSLKYQTTLVIVLGVFILGIYRWMNKNVLTGPCYYENNDEDIKNKNPTLTLFKSFKYLLSSKYFLLIMLITFCYGFTSTLVDGVFKSQIKNAFSSFEGAMGYMDKMLNLISFSVIFLSFIAVNILYRLSWYKAAIFTPLLILVTSLIFFGGISLGNHIGDVHYTILGASLGYILLFIGQIQNLLFKVGNMVFNSTKQIAFIPADCELKTKGQAFVEMFVKSWGTTFGAIIISTFMTLKGEGKTLLSMINIIGVIVIFACLIWFLAVKALSKHFEKLRYQNENN